VANHYNSFIASSITRSFLPKLGWSAISRISVNADAIIYAVVTLQQKIFVRQQADL
jgi:hypothetical protein